jgi:hypothetical protein
MLPAMRAAAQRIREFHPGFARATDTVIFRRAAQTQRRPTCIIAREVWLPKLGADSKSISRSRLKPINSNLPHHERIADPASSGVP